MDPEKLLSEVCRERLAKASRWKKLKWWWQNRCQKCGAKLVIGLVKGSSVYHFQYPVCEWCTRMRFHGTKFYKEEPKIISKENIAVGLVLLLVALWIFSCSQIDSQVRRSL